MKIVKIEDLHCNAGWRDFSFLKITTDEGIIGWSEYNEGYGSAGITAVIRRMAAGLIGENPRAVERIMSTQYAMTRQAPGGINQQAMAAIENALLDVKAKFLGVPVYELFGGKVRDTLPLYWSHCGSYRFHHAAVMGLDPSRSLDDLVALGAHVKARGFKALKTNIFRFDLNPPNMYQPGFARSPGGPELNADDATLAAIRDGLAAFRQGAGPNMGILLDTNFIASCESLFGRRQLRPFFEQRAMDVAIVDVPWNGLAESHKISTMAEAYEMNCAPHNFYGHLSTLMSGHFCASIPNFRIMEIDIDDVPWKDDLVTHPPVIRDGALIVPDRPGWGADINEEAVRAHPPRNPHPCE